MGVFGQSRERQPRRPAPDRFTASFRYRNTTLTGTRMADEPLMPQTEPEMCLSKHQVELLPLNPVMLSLLYVKDGINRQKKFFLIFNDHFIFFSVLYPPLGGSITGCSHFIHICILKISHHLAAILEIFLSRFDVNSGLLNSLRIGKILVQIRLTTSASLHGWGGKVHHSDHNINKS